MKLTYLKILLLFNIAVPSIVAAQVFLPEFSVIQLSAGNNRISWNNPHKNCIQLSVQRSSDSTNNFRTILSAQSPELVENGFIDKSAPTNGAVYYRIFYSLKGGTYYFSKTISPKKAEATKETKKTNSKKTTKNNKRSKNNKHKKEATANHIMNSKFIRINDKGNLIVALPKASELKYDLFIYNENKKLLFSIGSIHETTFTIEKVNFFTTGWFEYELFESGKQIEKQRFYIQ
jgi:hypothetical protein